MTSESANDRQDDDGNTPMPENPSAQPEQTVDALEDRVFGETRDQRRDEDSDRPAFEQDIDLADTTAESSGHTADEPPA
jgi:hypothetical protein